jgi:cytochrome o ubiquinol oxidase subunit 1
MAALGLCGLLLTLLGFAFRRQDEVEIAAEQVARFERAHQMEIVA